MITSDTPGVMKILSRILAAIFGPPVSEPLHVGPMSFSTEEATTSRVARRAPALVVVPEVIEPNSFWRPTADLRGKTFGRWVVIGSTPIRRASHTMWLCRCSCGVASHVRADRLLGGFSKSCGCSIGRGVKHA